MRKKDRKIVSESNATNQTQENITEKTYLVTESQLLELVERAVSIREVPKEKRCRMVVESFITKTNNAD